MRRSIVAIFLSVISGAAMLQAQRGGGGMGGGSTASHAGSSGGFGHAAVNGKGGGVGINGGNRVGRGFRRNRFGYGWGYGVWPAYYDGYGLDWNLPYWDYVNFPPSDAQYGPEPGYAENQPSRPTVVVQERQPAPPAQSPKLVEIPLPGDTTVKPVPPALFVLTNGEKLESRRYVLSANSLQVDIDRKQRTIPISELNIDATIAANQQRGIDISFPQDRSSLFLGF